MFADQVRSVAGVSLDRVLYSSIVLIPAGPVDSLGPAPAFSAPPGGVFPGQQGEYQAPPDDKQKK